MENTTKEVLERLLKSYQVYYNVNLFEDEQRALRARCDFFERSEKYVLSKKANLWTTECEEFLYLIELPHLTLKEFETWRDWVYADGMERIHVGPGHMYSYITPVFLCDTCDAEARRALKKCRIYKSFRFSLHGWMDFHTALVEVSTGKIESNAAGHATAKTLKSVL